MWLVTTELTETVKGVNRDNSMMRIYRYVDLDVALLRDIQFLQEYVSVLTITTELMVCVESVQLDLAMMPLTRGVWLSVEPMRSSFQLLVGVIVGPTSS